MRKWFSLFLIIFLLNAGSTQATEKTKLVFSLDQGWSNGLLVNSLNSPSFRQAMRQVIYAIKKFSMEYDVYVLINPLIRDETKLTTFLDTLKQYNIKFVLDNWSSDTLNIGSTTALPFANQNRELFNKAEDVSHGLTLNLNTLNNLKQSMDHCSRV